jgi:hypothetical protein
VARFGSGHEIITAHGSTRAGNSNGRNTEATTYSRDVTQTRTTTISTGRSATGLTFCRSFQETGGDYIAAADVKTKTEGSGESGANSIIGHTGPPS